MRAWWATLRRFDSEQIAAAITELPVHYPRWIPTLGEVVSAVKAARVEPEYEPPALPSPRDKAAAKKALSEIMRILNG